MQCAYRTTPTRMRTRRMHKIKGETGGGTPLSDVPLSPAHVICLVILDITSVGESLIYHYSINRSTTQPASINDAHQYPFHHYNPKSKTQFQDTASSSSRSCPSTDHQDYTPSQINCDACYTLHHGARGLVTRHYRHPP